MFSRVYEAGLFFYPASFYHIALNIFLCLQFLGYRQEFVVPLLSETLDERLLQEFVYADTLATALYHCVTTDVPLVEIDRYKVAHLTQTRRIEVAADGLAPVEASFVEGLLYEAEGATFAVACGKNTIFAVDDGGYKVAVGVAVDNALLGNNGTRLARHFTLDKRESLFEFLDLVECHGSSCVALDTANTFAVRGVAAEILCKNIERDDCIAYLYHIIFL